MDTDMIAFRKIQPSDYTPLAGIISKTWDYERLATIKAAHHMARIYLFSCLARQSFHLVATKNDIPVGIIMGKQSRKEQRNFPYLLAMIPSLPHVFFSGGGLSLYKIFGGVESADQELLKNTNRHFDAELSFFAVDANARGYGIGQALYNQLMEHYRREEIKDFYLFTDTACNVGFYEHQGMTRLGTQEKDLTQVGLGKMQFYIYGGNL